MSTLNAQSIRRHVTQELLARRGTRWFDPSTGKLRVMSPDNSTEFRIEIDITADRRHGAYDCQAFVVLKWSRFSALMRRLRLWYDGAATRYNGEHQTFLLISFDRIIHSDFRLPSRVESWVEDEESLGIFVDQCVDDLDGKVGNWIRRWFVWPSALEVMDGDEQLCGTWRDTAYFCLTEEVRGREAACEWLYSVAAERRPEFQAAQIDYLRSHVCLSGVANVIHKPR